MRRINLNHKITRLVAPIALLLIALTPACKNEHSSINKSNSKIIESTSLVGRWNTVKYCSVHSYQSVGQIQTGAVEYLTELKDNNVMVESYKYKGYDNNGNIEWRTNDENHRWEIVEDNIIKSDALKDSFGYILNRSSDRFDIVSHQCIYVFRKANN